MTASATRERWLAAHPYLAPAADLDRAVRDAAAAGAAIPPPSFEAYAADYAAGVPLLRSERAGIDVVAVTAAAVEAVLARLDGAPMPDAIRAQCRDLTVVLSCPAKRAAAIRFALDWGDDTPAPPHPGLLRLLAWKALGSALAPALQAFDAWRSDEGWRRAWCPTCGARPSLARLEAESDGRRRVLSCACCGTRWRYQRIGCPFCGNEVPGRLDCFEIGGEPAFRLDACAECGGYTKTFVGEGDEALFLSEWPTLHLDALARERGFRRAGASLYDL